MGLACARLSNHVKLRGPSTVRRGSATTSRGALWTGRCTLKLVIGAGVAWLVFHASPVTDALLAVPGEQNPRRVSAAEEKTFDELLLEVARRVPSFGGMYSDAQGHLFVYLLDPDARAEAEAAIISVFGRDTVPVEGIRVVQGQYRFLDLKAWHDRLTGVLLNKPGVVLTDVDEARNRVLIGTITGDPPARFDALLKKYAIPREAIIVEKVEPIGPQPKKRIRERRSGPVGPSAGHSQGTDPQ